MDYSAALQKEVLILRANSDEKVETGHETTDRQLVALALGGDESAYESIFDRHKRRVAVIASRFFRDPNQIEEIIQVSFTRAFIEIENFRGHHDFSLASWLNRIATNTCINALKAQHTKINDLVTAFADEDLAAFAQDLREKSAEELVIQRDLLEKLLRALDVEDRVLLQMLYAEEMTVAEVAESFGWSRANVKVRAFRARRSLAKIVKRFI